MRGPKAGYGTQKLMFLGDVDLPLPSYLRRASRAERARNGRCEGGVSQGDGGVGQLPRQAGGDQGTKGWRREPWA